MIKTLKSLEPVYISDALEKERRQFARLPSGWKGGEQFINCLPDIYA